MRRLTFLFVVFWGSVCMASLALKLQVQAGQSLESTKRRRRMSSKHAHNVDLAGNQVSQKTSDAVLRFLEAYDKERPKLMDVLDLFLETRVKDTNELRRGHPGFRSLATWGNGLADLHEMQGHKLHKEIYSRLLEIARWLRQAQLTMHSYVEDKVMRGWPMFITIRDKHPTFDAYQFGHIGRALALAAKVAADQGEHNEAVKSLERVLWYLHDGFLTNDPEMSRLDKNNRVVFVPKEASSKRKKRHLKATSGLARKCMSEPIPFNRGLAVAGAAMASIRAIDRIDWSRKQWPMTEWTMEECRLKLGTFVRDTAAWFRESMWEPPPTGADKRDKYPGLKGTSWVLWKYRDYSSCTEYQGTEIDRLEDIDHGAEDAKFVADYRHWAAEEPRSIELLRPNNAKAMFSHSLVRRMMVTFLNRIVADYNSPAKNRFACDIAGVNDGDSWGNSEKQCSSSRDRLKGFRPKAAVEWLVLALAASRPSLKQKDLRCDVLQLINAVLPLTIPTEDEFDRDSFAALHPSWTPTAIRVWHHFKIPTAAEIKDACTHS